MELRRISVNNLFGILNYDIDLGNSETIIITGPNGYGKTMLLKIIDNILNKNIDFFFDLRFEEIKFELDTILLCIEKQKNKNVAVTVVDYVNDKKRQEVFTLNKNKELDVDYFDEIYTSYEIGYIKPAPEIFKYMIKDANLVPEETLFIDDGASNIKIAKELGFQTYLVAEGEDWRDNITQLLGTI